MSHPEQTSFCRRMQQRYPRLFDNALALDVGSRDFNGSNRYLFTGGKYVGIDSVAGPNVDHVVRVHELDFPEECLDIVVSTEMLEHDEFRAQSLAKVVFMLKRGGHLLLTCAAPGRPVHGTDEYSGGAPYYENVDAETLLRELGPGMHALHVETRTAAPFDLYYFGRKI